MRNKETNNTFLPVSYAHCSPIIPNSSPLRMSGSEMEVVFVQPQSLSVAPSSSHTLLLYWPCTGLQSFRNTMLLWGSPWLQLLQNMSSWCGVGPPFLVGICSRWALQGCSGIPAMGLEPPLPFSLGLGPLCCFSMILGSHCLSCFRDCVWQVNSR